MAVRKLETLHIQAISSLSEMSYASKFTSSNRFAALSEDAAVASAAIAAAQPAPTPAARIWQQDARSALADEGGSRPTHTIFRRNAIDASAPVHSAFQGMHGGGASRAGGYQGLFKEQPKKYEDEFPSLGGKSAGAAGAAAAAAAPTGPSKFSELAKSWATIDADAAAVAAAAAAERMRLQRVADANASRSSSIYENIMARRRAAMTSGEPEFDYNEEVYRNQEQFNDEEGRTSPYSSHTPPYGHNEGAYDVDEYAQEQNI
jgi:hypothetical protein